MAGAVESRAKMIGREKAILRQDVRERLRGLSAEQRAAASASARLRLAAEEVWRRACGILGFAPLWDELDLWLLLADALKAGKLVALPRFDPHADGYVACVVTNLETDLALGKFGIREPRTACPPVALNKLDFVLVPGVAFDLKGRRLGRGKGYYDRLLAGVAGRTCGAGFDEQFVPEVPVEKHDAVLDCLLTPTRWLEF
jgi:5-formyltetrahydrofolate cyclo-ligase